MFKRFWQLVEANGRLYGELLAVQVESTRLRANCDFLAAQVTKLEAERAVLLERVLGVQLPVFQVERQQEPVVAPRVPPDLTPEALAKLTPRSAPMPEGLAGQVFRLTPQGVEAETEAAMAIFEDIGDARAARLGISHMDDGTVVHT
jgi:hypothetical protein